MSETTNSIEPPGGKPPPRPGPRRQRATIAASLIAAGLVGAGATALAQRGHRPVLVALTPAPITAMHDDSLVAVKGQVAEIFGDKFILADASGRALVDTGRDGRNGDLVSAGETVTIQGRFAQGSIRAAAIQHGDGRSIVLGPPPPPPPPHPPLG